MMCAWLKDKFGVVWQIVPDELIRLITDPDSARAQRAVGAMMRMQTTVHAPIGKVWKMPSSQGIEG